MAFSEFEKAACEIQMDRYIEKVRPAPEIRPKLDIGYSIDGQAVEIFEIRPTWKDPSVYQNHGVAKARYVKTQGEWRIYWLRADLKWHSYAPQVAVARLEDFLAIVEEDHYGCFWG